MCTLKNLTFVIKHKTGFKLLKMAEKMAETGALSADSASDSDSNPPSSGPKSNQFSDRLDFGHMGGGRMAARKTNLEKRKLASVEGLEEGELSTDSEFEVPRKLQKTDNKEFSESSEMDNSLETNDKTVTEEEEQDDTTMMESEHMTEEFHILDEADIDEDDDGNANVDSDDELDDNEIYAWLEEGIEKPERKTERQGDGDTYVEKEKVVLKELGRNPFEVLPEGWVMITHNSGMPVFLHKQSRVCTLSKPYFLGPGSVRKHSVPASSIPCFHYRREKEKEAMKLAEPVQGNESVNPEPVQENGDKMKGMVTQSGSGGGEIPSGSAENPETQANTNTATVTEGRIPAPEIKSLEHSEKENSIEPEDLMEYCMKLFDFKTIKVKKFKSWKEKRKHLNDVKAKTRPSLPTDIKLITCPVQSTDNVKSKVDKAKKKEFIINPVGKTALCILHEYVQHVMRVQPVYKFKELENAITPYSATVSISDVEYGTGLASSKKVAKLEAAKKTLAILIPHLKLDGDNADVKKNTFGDLAFFDEIGIEDPRIADLCNKAALLKPYQVLQECLRRNYGMAQCKINIDKKVISNQKSEFTISLGKHTATIVSRNKREGKQMAAQAMLQLLHPHIQSWGSMLRLYSDNTVKGFKEKEAEPVTQLQSKQSSLNTDILNKLKTTMRKLSERKEQFVSKGTLRIAYRVPQTQVKKINL